LVDISTAQTLKIEGYIKKKKVTMLINSGSTHNVINCKLAKDLNFFIYLASEFQVMIVDGGTINCFGKCHSIKLNMGEYLLDSPMIAIQMGGVDIVLGVQWLQSLGTMAFNFQDPFMRFSSEGKEIELRGMQGKPSNVISSNNMTKLLKKGHNGIIAQLISIDVQTSISFAPMNLQKVINNHSKVFGEIPKDLPPLQDHAHAIHLRKGSVHPFFHVSCLKKITNDKVPMQTILPKMNGEGKIILEPKTILEIRIKKLQNQAITEYLVKWKMLLVEEATWEDDFFMHTKSRLSSVDDNYNIPQPNRGTLWCIILMKTKSLLTK
jgi:hypothetical protein